MELRVNRKGQKPFFLKDVTQIKMANLTEAGGSIEFEVMASTVAPKRDFRVGDIVRVKKEASRTTFSMAPEISGSQGVVLERDELTDVLIVVFPDVHVGSLHPCNGKLSASRGWFFNADDLELVTDLN